MSSEFTHKIVMKFLPTPFPCINIFDVKVFEPILPILNNCRDFIIAKKFTAHYACMNADLNLILFATMTNGFIFQMIDSLIESTWGYA